MPTPSNSTHGDILPSDVPAEIRELYLSSHCPPEYTPADVAPEHSLAQDLPTPPQDTPAIPPTSHERARRNAHWVARPVPDNAGPPHGLFSQQPHGMPDGVPLTTGPAVDGIGLRQRPSPRQRRPTDEVYHPAQEGGNALDQLERLRLLENARADSHPATMEYLRRRRQEVLEPSGGHVRMGSGSHERMHPQQWEAVRQRSERHDSWRQSLAPQLGDSPMNPRPQVRWPPTLPQSGQWNDPQLSREHVFGSQAPLVPRSGPTSVDEELLRRAYRTLQEPQALEQYRPARESSERSTRTRRQPSWIGPHTPLSTYEDSSPGSYPRNHLSRFQLQPLSDSTANYGDLDSIFASPETASQPPSAESEANSKQGREHQLSSSKYISQRESAYPSKTAVQSHVEQVSRSTATSINQPISSRTLGIYTPHYLYPGAVFTGKQQSDQRTYPLTVVLKHIDLAKSFLCGHLTIDNLTDNHPRLETYFEAEIIGSRYRFPTRHPTWGASEKQDMIHWRKFSAWHPLMRSQVEAAQTASRSQNSTTGSGRTISPREQAAVWEKPIPNWSEREYIFMRWKEYFLVPDHKVTNISGASFEGFYYICFDVKNGRFHGIYYHAKSERWQQLDLCYAVRPDKGCRGATELC